VNSLTESKEYKNWLIEIKSKIRTSQIKASLSVNAQLVKLHWDIGAMIAEKQEKAKWGSALLEQMAKDLKNEFPNITGFSRSNLYSMRQFYQFYRESGLTVHQLGGKTLNVLLAFHLRSNEFNIRFTRSSLRSSVEQISFNVTDFSFANSIKSTIS